MAATLGWWFYLRPAPLPAGIAAGNGRIEAVQAGQEAEAQPLRARSALHLAHQELHRTATLNRGGSATGKLLDQRRTAVEVVDATIAAAEATQRRAQAVVEAAQAHVAQARTVLGADLRQAAALDPLRARIAYMPQGLGRAWLSSW